MRSFTLGSRALLASLGTIYAALLALALFGGAKSARYDDPAAYVVLGLCSIGVILHVSIVIKAPSLRIAALNLLSVLALIALTLAALTSVTGDSL
jgi:hypothetical protein